MRTLRPAFAADPRQFGRGRLWNWGEPVRERRWSISDDLWLFATTFAGGFVFVSILIG